MANIYLSQITPKGDRDVCIPAVLCCVERNALFWERLELPTVHFPQQKSIVQSLWDNKCWVPWIITSVSTSCIVIPSTCEPQMASNNLVCLPSEGYASLKCLMSLQFISIAETHFGRIESTHFSLWSSSTVHGCQKCSAFFWHAIMSQLHRSKAVIIWDLIL